MNAVLRLLDRLVDDALLYQKALTLGLDKDPKVQGTHGYIVAKAAQRYVDALVKAGHTAKTLHDINETHSSLVGGYGAPGDPTTAAVTGGSSFVL